MGRYHDGPRVQMQHRGPLDALMTVGTAVVLGLYLSVIMLPFISLSVTPFMRSIGHPLPQGLPGTWTLVVPNGYTGTLLIRYRCPGGHPFVRQGQIVTVFSVRGVDCVGDGVTDWSGDQVFRYANGTPIADGFVPLPTPVVAWTGGSIAGVQADGHGPEYMHASEGQWRQEFAGGVQADGHGPEYMHAVGPRTGYAARRRPMGLLSSSVA